MKHIGDKSDFVVQRDEELMKAYRDAPPGVNFAETPCSRFWVSERRAANVMARLELGEELPMKFPEKRRMYLELYRRMRKLRSENPGLTIMHAMEEIVNSPAPSFYMAQVTAERKVSEIIQRRRMMTAKMKHGAPNRGILGRRKEEYLKQSIKTEEDE